MPTVEILAHQCGVFHLAAQAQPSASAASTVPAWQRNAVPFYDTVHALQGIYGHWALPRAQAFDRSAQALTNAMAAMCSGNADTNASKAALESARNAWLGTTRAWEELSAIAIGPVIARRTQRAIDFALVGGNHFAADDQQAVLVAQNMTLDQHIAAFGFCQVVGRFNFGLCAQLE